MIADGQTLGASKKRMAIRFQLVQISVSRRILSYLRAKRVESQAESCVGKVGKSKSLSEGNEKGADIAEPEIFRASVEKKSELVPS